MFTFCNDYKAYTYIVSLGIAGQFSSTWTSRLGPTNFSRKALGMLE